MQEWYVKHTRPDMGTDVVEGPFASRQEALMYRNDLRHHGMDAEIIGPDTMDWREITRWGVFLIVVFWLLWLVW